MMSYIIHVVITFLFTLEKKPPEFASLQDDFKSCLLVFWCCAPGVSEGPKEGQGKDFPKRALNFKKGTYFCLEGHMGVLRRAHWWLRRAHVD